MRRRFASKGLSRRFVLAGLLAGTAWPALANAPATSERPVPRPAARPTDRGLARLLRDAGVSGAVSFAVADARTGRILEAHVPEHALPPASVTKAVTALYALERLGDGYRFRTKLVGTGPIEGGVLKGDLVLVGSGDPTLDTDALGDMAQALKAAGVTKVDGAFRVNAGALPTIREIDTSQPDHVGYNPGISGVNLNYNRVHFEWKRSSGGYEVAMDARATRYRPTVDVSRMRIVDRRAPIYTYSSKGGVDEWTVARGALGKGGARWLPVRRPEAYAADVFRSLAAAQGIPLADAKIETKAAPSGRTLAEHASPPLREMLTGMLKWSTNLTAEAVGLTATVAAGRRPATLTASAGEMSRWMQARFGPGTAKFVDHSGLGDRSRLTASEMVEALVATGHDGPLAPILKQVKVKDDNGTPIKSAKINVRAKTGTLNFVSSLAGYVFTPDGRPLAFAILTADTERRAGIAPNDRERPAGAKTWVSRSRKLQHRLVRRWVRLYSA